MGSILLNAASSYPTVLACTVTGFKGNAPANATGLELTIESNNPDPQPPVRRSPNCQRGLTGWYDQVAL